MIHMKPCCFIPHLAGLYALIASVLISFSATAQVAETTVTFQIGEIPPQRVWYSDIARIQFVVQADILGENPTITAEFDTTDGTLGTRSFGDVDSVFSYFPDPADSEPFNVTFRGEGNGTSVAQTVTITPLRPLPPETSVFGLTPKGDIPNSESNEFIDVETEIVSGSVWFNAATRNSVRKITIIGKAIVFEENHANELWGYHDNEDIQSMTIHAETLIIRGALRLPQTNLEIYCTEIRFEDSDGVFSSLSTEPRSSAGQPAKQVDGRAGHNAGSLTLFTDAVTAEGSEPRFLLKGGNGERAGQGIPGSKGASRSTVKEIKNGIYKWSWSDSNTIYAKFDGLVDTTVGNSTWPGNGTNAKPGGKPGIAGDGGLVTSNLDLSAWVDNSGGSEGTRANYVSGGAGGDPRPAYRRYFNKDKQTSISTHYSSSGTSYSGPASAKVTGLAPEHTVLSGDLRWLSPVAMQKVLIHFNQAYLHQHFDFVRTNLDDYIELIELAQASEAWIDLEESARNDLTQILDEMRSLKHRLGSNLDYFGNPAGWVPMLSFEVNKLAFENEIPRALRVMYLNYWLGNKADTIQDKIDAMTAMRAQLKKELENDRDEYQQVVASVPGLEFKARKVQEDIDTAKTDIETLKNSLLDKAKNIALLKKTAKALGAVAEIFPVGQPYVGLAGSTISQIADADPDKPLEENALIIGTNVAGDFANSKMSEKADAQRVEAGEIDLEDLEAEKNAEQQQKMRELQGPIMDVLGESLNQIRNSQSPTPEVEAELQRLLADEPAYKDLVKEIKKLNRDKADFAVELAQTMQKVVNLTLAISKNLLIVDILNRNIQDNSLVLDAETLGYLDAMNQRARDRLLKYHYFMARAYEYRMLKPYDGELDLTKIFDKFAELADAGNTSELTPEQFDSLQAVYEDQISSVVFSILDEYNSNRPSLSAPVRLTLSQQLLDQLNAGETGVINLHDEQLFLPDQENLRIVDLQVIDLEVEYVGNQDDIFYSDIIFQHSGVSSLQKEGEAYLFRHYNDETRSKIEWSTRFDPFDSSLDPVRPSAAEQSLLKSLLSTGSSSPSTEDLLLYSRPAAKADLLLTKQTNGRFGADVRITRMRIELIYDFSRKNEQIKSLSIVGDPDGAQPLVKVSKTDLNQRQNGEGSFDRSYDIGSTVVLEAPEKIGQYVFDSWQGSGITDPNSPTTSVIMNSNTQVRPIYRSVVPTLVQIVGGTGSGTYTPGEMIPITAVIPEGYEFVRWDGTGVSDPLSPDTFVSASEDVTVEAIFKAIQAITAWLGNISNRAQVGIGSDILIPGFVIEGTAPKEVLVRAVGPTLVDFGVTGVLENPLLRVFQGSTEVASNDDWGQASDPVALANAMATTGAFALQPGSGDSALLVTLDPGAYTAQVSGVGDTTGVAIVEVYDAAPDNLDSRLVNISGRAQVGTGADILIPGFVVSGSESKQYLIRAIGPTLAGFGVTGTLADPMLRVLQGDTEIVTNDNWMSASNAAEVVSTSATIGAFALDEGSADAVVLIDLNPGAYTIQVSGVADTTGVALVEIYEVQE